MSVKKPGMSAELEHYKKLEKIIYGWIAGSLSSTNNQLPAAGFATLFTRNLPALDVPAYSGSVAIVQSFLTLDQWVSPLLSFNH
jgi:hypothetical protein